jgi:WD domain, G-beta repeat
LLAVGTPRGSIFLRDLAAASRALLPQPEPGEVPMGISQQVHSLRGHDAPVSLLAFSPDGRSIACAYRDSTVLIWDIASLALNPLSGGGLSPEQLWVDLAADQPAIAWKAHWGLVAGSTKSVALVKGRLRPVPRPDARMLAQRLNELDSIQYAVRERAMKELENMGPAAEPALHKALKTPVSLETNRRLRQLLDRLEQARRRQVQELRALAVLEQIASDEARAIMDALAAGDPEARLTIAAQAGRKRLAAASGR